MIQVKQKKRKDKSNQNVKEENVQLIGNGSNSKSTDDNDDLYRNEYKYKPSLTKVFLRTYGAYFLTANVIKFFHDCMVFVSPYILKY